MAKKNKRQQDIKTKLMAAICMLLVSSIMMVSSTYAWFTLSTAPEVTGINTTVGSNGSLEMALLPTSGLVDAITSAAGDSMAAQDVNLANVTWGNLVDVSDNKFYGLNQITLYPSELNSTNDANGNPLSIGASLLSTPKYGADGRITSLSPNTVAYILDQTSGSFLPGEDANGGAINQFGVRAIGTTSGMTDRQLAYRNARSTASTAMSSAKVKASQSLSANGAKLANIVVTKATSDSGTYTQKDVANLLAIVNDLRGEDGVLALISTAYYEYIIAYAASYEAQQNGVEDLEFAAFRSTFEDKLAEDGATLLSAIEAMEDELGFTVPAEAKTPLTNLAATVANVESAYTDLKALETAGSDAITWTEISVPLYKLADVDAMAVNGIAASEIRDDSGDYEVDNEKGTYYLVDGVYTTTMPDGYTGDKYSPISNMTKLVNSVMGGGLTVTMASGGGVYADIADHCGDYSAKVDIDKISYGGMSVGPITAVMETESAKAPAYYLTLVSDKATAAKEPSGSGEAMPISDFYGYVIDLAFRTNAAGSNLLLQSDPVDRIYEDSTTGVEDSKGITTMGHGSSMTFTSPSTSFSDTQIKGLMEGIRIVFFTIGTDSNTVIATAKLDAANATLEENGWEANIVLYTMVEDTENTKYVKNENGTYKYAEYYTQDIPADYTGTKYVQNVAEDGTVTYTENAAGTWIKTQGYIEIAEGENYEGDKFVKVFTTKMVLDTPNADGNYAIMELPQNVATQVSVLVYLDGNVIDNGDVAVDAAASLTGTMNLQFSSSADLKPMTYTDLTEQTGNAGGASSDASSEAASESSETPSESVGG